MIQITAPNPPGSSGSPVINELGQVIAIATMINTARQQNGCQSACWRRYCDAQRSYATAFEASAPLTSRELDATRKTGRRVKVWGLDRPPLLGDPTTLSVKLERIKDEIRKLSRTDKIEIYRWIDDEMAAVPFSRGGEVHLAYGFSY